MVARNPAVTFRGALSVFGRDDPPWVQALDLALGGILLASGVIPPIAALWGWIDQKNEAVRLLREAMQKVDGRLSRAEGLHRHELAIAAHTLLVLTAFFETAHASLGPTLQQAKITDEEKLTLAIGTRQHLSDEPLKQLYDTDVPAPSVSMGFGPNVALIRNWSRGFSRHLERFLGGLEVGPVKATIPAEEVVNKYRDLYQEMMQTVPEFKIWAEQIEHAATHTALSKLENLLQTANVSTSRPLCSIVSAINRGELDRPVLDVDSDGYGVGATFPPVKDIFVSPRAVLEEIDVGDLDVLFAQHFTSAAATVGPLLLLGHPGAGKSLLTKVVAARLSGSRFTVVRVPLREVDANAPINVQIDQALKSFTHGRATWADLSDESASTVRVILLDGLDELLQATTQDRHNYLHEVAEFQRVEALVGRAVAVVVTSRSLVASRLRVPADTPVVELADFNDSQIDLWLKHWNRVNVAPKSRPMPLEIALGRRNLACQPLLLLMLALYYSDPEAEISSEMSTSELYSRLLDTYARREVVKTASERLSQEKLRRLVEDQLRRLSTAALGMFNRGRQSITESQLSSDLSALLDSSVTGERVLGEFFFVHDAQASSGGVLGEATSVMHRRYEFLHATFAEYLVASQIVDTVAEVASTALRSGLRPRPDDDLLFALLSYQPISAQRPIRDFATQRLAAQTKGKLTLINRTLDMLLSDFRSRPESRHFSDYRPAKRDHVRALACYSANLVLLRLAASPNPVRISAIWKEGEEDGLDTFQSCLSLWRAGMDSSSFQSVIAAMWQDHGRLSEFRGKLTKWASYDIHQYLLGGDWEIAGALAFGRAALDPNDGYPRANYLGVTSKKHVERTLELMAAVPIIQWDALVTEIESESPRVLRAFGRRFAELLASKPGRWPAGLAGRFAQIALDSDQVSPEVLGAAAFRHKEVYDLVQDRSVAWVGAARELYVLATARYRRLGDAVTHQSARSATMVIDHLLNDR